MARLNHRRASVGKFDRQPALTIGEIHFHVRANLSALLKGANGNVLAFAPDFFTETTPKVRS